MIPDEAVLYEPERLVAAGGEILAAAAASGASLRSALHDLDAGVISAAADQGRPRALVVMGAGGSGAAGDIVSACAGSGSAVPVVTLNGPALPGWVGPLDIVVPVSASGRSPETLQVAAEAARRGSQVVGIGFGGPLADQVLQQRGLYLQLREPREPLPARALTWALVAPLMLLADRLGIVEGAQAALTAAGEALDEQALSCGPQQMPGDNRAKDLAVVMAESLGLLWGGAGVPAAAARRAGRQFAENAGVPAVVGALPEVARTHARLLAGSWGPEDDIFRDRVAEPEITAQPHLVLFTDDVMDDLSAELTAALIAVAGDTGVPVTVLTGGSGHPLVRFARLSSIADFASIYAAAVLGLDPAGTAKSLHPQLGSGR